MKLGEYLIEQGLIKPDQFHVALNEARASGSMLGDSLVRLGFLRWKQLEETLKKIAPETIIESQSSQQLVILPTEFMRSSRTIFKGETGTGLSFATLHVDPDYIQAELERLTGKSVTLSGATGAEFESLYDENEDDEEKGLLTHVEDPNLVISTIINEALQLEASDIHIESTELSIHIRYRIHGILEPMHVLSNNISERLFARIKGEADLDEAQKREPQDGAFTRIHKGRSFDFRVATVPTAIGEKIVIRILDKDTVMVDVRSIGITAIDDWMYLSRQNDGLILVCGPTGSGKTTTLYSTLMSHDRLHKSVYTIEDPIEYRLPCINQVETRPAVGLTFVRALRAFMRLDPDIMVVGEIRDLETAEMTVHAADTGHLVYATTHANDIMSVLNKLIGYGVKLEQLAYSLRGIIVQKLVRKLCPNCGGEGCSECRKGYRGRTMISEFVRIDTPETMTALIKRDLPYQTFEQDALLKVQEGITDCREVSRVMNTEVWFCSGGNCINKNRANTDHICNWIGDMKAQAAIGAAHV